MVPIVDARLSEQQRERERVQFLRRVAVPDAELLFGEHDQTPAIDGVNAWLPKSAGETPSHGLILRGAVGTGKSIALAYAVGRLGLPFCWLRPDELVSAVLHAYADGAPKLQPVVVVDDIGRETKADFTEALCVVLDDRSRLLLGSTNLHKLAMREHYDQRLLDRLCARCIAFDVPGASLRPRAGDF